MNMGFYQAFAEIAAKQLSTAKIDAKTEPKERAKEIKKILLANFLTGIHCSLDPRYVNTIDLDNFFCRN